MALPRLFKQSKDSVPGFLEADLKAWFETELGKNLIEQQQKLLDQILPGTFGYHQMQAGLGIADNSLCASPIRHKFLISPEHLSDSSTLQNCDTALPLRASLKTLPIMNDCIDSAVLHHSLEYETNINQILRETARVLMPGGSLIIIGFNPWSLWGFWRRGVFKFGSGPWSARFVSPYRVSEWLELLDFEVEGSESSHYLPPIKNERIVNWFRWLEPLCAKILPHSGAFYVLVAKKRVSLITPIRPKWRPSVRQFVPVAIPQTSRNTAPDQSKPGS